MGISFIRNNSDLLKSPIKKMFETNVFNMVWLLVKDFMNTKFIKVFYYFVITNNNSFM